MDSSRGTDSNQRLLAAVAHAGVTLTPLGIALPAMVWGLQRKKSAYVRFQSAQALAYQIAYNAILLIGSLITFIITLVLIAVISRHVTDPEKMQSTLVMVAFIPIIFACILTLAYFALGLVGCVACILGKDFLYPWIGRLLRTYTADEPQPGTEAFS